VHKSTAGKGKLPAAARAFVLGPAGDGVIPGTAAMGAGKTLGPADTEQQLFAGFFVHRQALYFKNLPMYTCNNLINDKFYAIFVFFTIFSGKILIFGT
jgi:hypothetical protein